MPVGDFIKVYPLQIFVEQPNQHQAAENRILAL